MKTDVQRLFRSYQAMDAIYQQRHAAGKSQDAYLVKLQRDNQALTFFGCRHSNDVQDSQNKTIEHEWELFVNNANKHKIAFEEGGLRPYEPIKDLAIEKYSEAGLLIWLATQDDVQLVSPEPDGAAEVTYLLAQGLSVAEIMTYYFGRQMLQWLRADHRHNPSWKQYATRHIASYAQLEPLRKENIDVTKVLGMFQTVTGEAFDETNEKLLYSIIFRRLHLMLFLLPVAPFGIFHFFVQLVKHGKRAWMSSPYTAQATR